MCALSLFKMLSVSDLTFHYPKAKVDAVSNASATFGPGIHLLVGENGAGKTTLLHLLAGLFFPSQGLCMLDDKSIPQRNPEVLNRTFFLGEDFQCPFSTINSLARRHGVFYPNFSFAQLKKNLSLFGQTGDEKIKRMSLGTSRKAFCAYALALATDVLLLDEPTNGMDIDSRKAFRKLLSLSISDSQTIIIATHNVLDFGNIFDGISVMKGSRLMLSMPLWKIAERISFVTSSSPVKDAIYQETDGGLFRAIVGLEDGVETEVSLPMLYSAIMSPIGEPLVNYLIKDGK